MTANGNVKQIAQKKPAKAGNLDRNPPQVSPGKTPCQRQSESESNAIRPEQQKHKSFREAWQAAFLTHEEQQARQHFSRTNDRAFNDLLVFFGENYFNIIVKDNRPSTPWRTITEHPTPPRNLLALWWDTSQIVGVRFGTLTRLVVLDIDAQSAYHPAINRQEYDRLLETLEGMGLVGYECVRSSDSGGLHLLYPLPDAVPSFLTAHGLHVTLSKAGFTLAKGHLEIFPNRKGFAEEKVISYQGIRLPLQPDSGSYALDPIELSPVYHDLPTLIAYLQHHAARQDMDAFKRTLKAAWEGFFVAASGYVGSTQSNGKGAAAFEQALLERVMPGWTGDGQTNDLVCEAVKLAYVFWGWDGDELVRNTTAFLRTLPGYQRYCGHQHNLASRVRDWLLTVRDTLKYYPYTGEFRDRGGVNYGEAIAATSTSDRIDGRQHNPANAARYQATRKKLAEAVRLLRAWWRSGVLEAPQTTTGVLEAIIATAKQHFGAGFSLQFLYRFKGLLSRLQAFASRVVNTVASVSPSPVEAENSTENNAENTGENSAENNAENNAENTGENSAENTGETPPSQATEALPSSFAEPSPSPAAETLALTDITIFPPNNEGVGIIPPQAVTNSEALRAHRQQGTIFKYTGMTIHGQIEIPHPDPSKHRPYWERYRWAVIPEGCRVQLTDDVHSTEDSAGAAYVKPVGKRWPEGIAVSIAFLIPESPLEPGT